MKRLEEPGSRPLIGGCGRLRVLLGFLVAEGQEGQADSGGLNVRGPSSHSSKRGEVWLATLVWGGQCTVGWGWLPGEEWRERTDRSLGRRAFEEREEMQRTEDCPSAPRAPRRPELLPRGSLSGWRGWEHRNLQPRDSTRSPREATGAGEE